MGADVVVIGGGFAGLSAAVHMANRGAKVHLVEKRAFLGGRTYSIPDRQTGEMIDNGQHVIMGCYHETMRLLRLLQTEDGIYFQRDLLIPYRSHEGLVDRLHCPHWPGPFHLLGGLMRMHSLSWKDKWSAIRFGLSLKRKNNLPASETVDEYCKRLRQPPDLSKTMWQAIALSALNEQTDKADANLFRTVMQQGFLATARDSRMGLPSVPLQSLHGEHAVRFIESRGGTVHLKKSVKALNTDQCQITSVVLSTGEEIECNYCISAIPHRWLQGLVDISGISDRITIPDLGRSPILSVYLWYEQPFSDEMITCLLDTEFEWIFHRHHFMKTGFHDKPCVCLVASACRPFESWTRQQLIETAIRNVQQTYPESRSLNPIASKVFWEPNATFSTTPENSKKRLNHQTKFANLFLAGDWTNTGLPATIEGAALSGRRCADLIEK